MNIDESVGARALRILRAVPDLEVVTEEDRDSLAVLIHAGTKTRIAVEVKGRVDVAAAHRLVRQVAVATLPMLVVARETTAAAREVLADGGVGLVDGDGNVWLDLPGLIVRITGSRQVRRPTAKAALSGKSGLVAQALLLDPERRWQITELVEEVGVSTGLVHRVVKRLESVGILGVYGTGPKRTRRVIDATALLDLWDEEQTDRPIRTSAFVLAQTARQLVETLGARLARDGVEHAFTAAAAAMLLAPVASAVPVTEVWVDATAPESAFIDPPTVAQADEGYNVSFLQGKDDAAMAFRTEIEGTWVTNRFRLYHDLRQDPQRGEAQADHFREQVIGF